MNSPKTKTTVLITGARGFIGRNLAAHLRMREEVALREYDLDNSIEELRAAVAAADVIFHLAGVNRPPDPAEFAAGNADFTAELCELIAAAGKRPLLILSSSIQAEQDNPYGASKRRAEEIVAACTARGALRGVVFRLKNVFGKWCRPNYNSVTATFCHNIAHDLPIQINDPQRELELVCVDDVVAAMVAELDRPQPREEIFVEPEAIPSYTISLGDLADRVRAFRALRETLLVPDFSVRFNQQLYATYLSYVEPANWEYGLHIRSDDRGNLAEFIKSPWFGQIFLSRTRPGITRGNHFHHTKTEKFAVIAGEGLIRFRPIDGSEIIEFRVRGEDYRVVEIPPGFTHSITNVGETEMITLFWASEVFDPARADTYFLPVDLPDERAAAK